MRCAISSPLSSADLQNRVTDILLIRQQNRFLTVYSNTASFLTFVPKRYKKNIRTGVYPTRNEKKIYRDFLIRISTYC